MTLNSIDSPFLLLIITQLLYSPRNLDFYEFIKQARPMKKNDPFETALSIGNQVRLNFDWKNPHHVFEKVEEEVRELKESLEQTKIEQIHEMGDVLFTLVQLARHLEIDIHSSLEMTNARHKKRTDTMKSLMKKDGLIFESSKLEILEQYWTKAKKQLKSSEKDEISNLINNK